MKKFKTFDDYVADRCVREQRIMAVKSPDKALDGIKLDLKKGTLYWAYGSNLNVEAMAHRCPGAIKIQPLTLKHGALVFRGVADVVSRRGSTVHGGLWWITNAHEKTLDSYEGVESRLYLKRYLKLKFKDVLKPYPCLYYAMPAPNRGICPPNEHYYGVIQQGYQDFGLPVAALEKALDHAWDFKHLTPKLRERRLKRGGQLARREMTQLNPIELTDGIAS